MLFAWAMKFNRKYVGPIQHHTTQEGVCILQGLFEGRGWTPLNKASQTKSEWHLPASERENGWWVAYGSKHDSHDFRHTYCQLVDCVSISWWKMWDKKNLHHYMSSKLIFFSLCGPCASCLLLRHPKNWLIDWLIDYNRRLLLSM